MTSSNGHIFRVTGPLCGGFTEMNNRDAGDLRRHWAHYDVTVMINLRRSSLRFIMGIPLSRRRRLHSEYRPWMICFGAPYIYDWCSNLVHNETCGPDVFMKFVFHIVWNYHWMSMLCSEGCNQGSWWRHRIGTSSALLALYEGIHRSPVDSPSQRPVTRSFDVFFDVLRNKRLST